jgi:N-acetylglucosamine kinase-like BadF-type ATPase
VFFKRRWEHIYYYGAGCANMEKNKIMELSLVAQFKTPVTVMSDLLGAARGLLINKPGLACILGTGSNSCLYNGHEIVKTVPPLGFILGDEGSAAYLGKTLIADILKGIAPKELCNAFFEKFMVTQNVLLDDVYSNPLPSKSLTHYSSFLSEHLDNAYVYQMIYSAFMRFFTRNIAAYDYQNQPLCFAGSVAEIYRDILDRAAADFGVKISKVMRYSMPGLVEYHALENE